MSSCGPTARDPQQPVPRIQNELPLAVRDDLDLNERAIERNTRYRDRCPYRRFHAEPTDIRFIHRLVVLELCQIYIALQAFFIDDPAVFRQASISFSTNSVCSRMPLTLFVPWPLMKTRSPWEMISEYRGWPLGFLPL